MRFVSAILFVVLAACNMPEPGFGDVAPVRITVGKSVFDVRVAGRWAEAVRLTPEWAPRPAAVVPRAVVAIEAVSRCRAVRLGGDQAVILAQLDCGAGPPPRPPPTYICAVEDLGKGEADLVCRPRPD